MQMHIKTAFLNSDLDKRIYVKPPPGMEEDFDGKSLWFEAITNMVPTIE